MQDPVIVRDADGSPLKRVALEGENGLIYLATPELLVAVWEGKSDPVGFPCEDVFQFDEGTYAALIDQWARQRATEPALWRSLKRYEPPLGHNS